MVESQLKKFNKKIIITGGSGYIGSKLVPYLVNKGFVVKVIDKMDFGNNLKKLKNLSVVQSDLFNCDVSDFQGYSSVIHLAALSNDPLCNFKPSDNFIQNLAAVSHVAFLAKSAGVKKFIQAGSCSVYGKNLNNCSDETIKPHSEFPYGISKLQAEKSLKLLQDDNFKVTILRQATVYGWAPRMRTDLVVNTMTKCAVIDKVINVDNPDACRPLIHIDDLCKVYSKVLVTNSPFIMNVSVENYKIIDIAEQVRQKIIEYLPDVEINIKNIDEPRSYFVDNSLMKKTVGTWNYKTIEFCIDELIAHIPVSDIDEWSNPDYINLEMYRKNYDTLYKVGGSL